MIKMPHVARRIQLDESDVELLKKWDINLPCDREAIILTLEDIWKGLSDKADRMSFTDIEPDILQEYYDEVDECQELINKLKNS
jgi:hypothetical protein